MIRENYGQIIQGIIIAIIAVICGYFIEPLMAVLGLLIASSYVEVAVVQYYRRESSTEHSEKEREVTQP
ncbi:MAG TPA: hypothetical protein VJY54_02335 [Lachnospiraceae bacterium]|nr:hypothetical protein [Lachnospiraceae bacterium]